MPTAPPRAGGPLRAGSKWTLPAFSVFLGLLVLAAMWAGGNPVDGFLGLGLMTALALALALGGRSETVRALRGDGRDERWAMLDLRATALAGLAVLTTLIGLWLYELAQGHDGGPYGQIMAVGGLSYIVAIVVLRIRS